MFESESARRDSLYPLP